MRYVEVLSNITQMFSATSLEEFLTHHVCDQARGHMPNLISGGEGSEGRSLAAFLAPAPLALARPPPVTLTNWPFLKLHEEPNGEEVLIRQSGGRSRIAVLPCLLTVCVGGSCSEISDPDKNAEDGPSHVPDCVKPCLVDG